MSPDSAPLPPSFLSALESPPFNLQSPPRGGGKLSAAAEAAVATAREEGTPGLIPYVPQGLVKPLVEAFGVLSAADATDKRVRCEWKGYGSKIAALRSAPCPCISLLVRAGDRTKVFMSCRQQKSCG